MNSIPKDMWQNSLLFVAEKITNACLKLDPGTKERLKALDGKCLAFHLRDDVPFYQHGIHIFVLPTQTGVELTAETSCVADAGISLYAKDIILLIRDAAIPEHLIIEGDELLLFSVLEILKELDLDWESALAPIGGDVIAHAIGKQVRNTEKWMKSSYQEVKRLADEYFEEELPAARQSEKLKPLFTGLANMKSFSASLREGWRK